jgi:outer membrane protein assembly factor BamB
VVFNFSKGVTGIPTISNHDRTVYFSGTDNNTYAVSIDSQLEQWSLQGAGGISSAAIGPECVIFIGSSDGNVYAIDANAGLERWR